MQTDTAHTNESLDRRAATVPTGDEVMLSVVIVNYNVRYFLEQCLQSVFAATEGMTAEVWVVDNNSVDGSVAMVRSKFPQVRLIANSDNPGFGRANNQALRQVKGKYVLMLNPDTLVPPDTFHRCIDFMLSHPDCGGLGVKMLNGEGQFLKESKRGFPSPETSFYKISGLIHLFPHHKRIAYYYLGHLSEDETHEVDILPGAYLMMSREALDKVGYFDEAFFMYGEDIDLSWRIRLAGFKNYYLPSARIIHYKGESTKKGSLNYVYTFYNAMAIFARKYFSGPHARLYNGLITVAIWLRALLSFVQRIVRRVALPLADFLLAFGGFVAIKWAWAAGWASNVAYYPPVYTWGVLPLYVLFMMLVCWLYGGYERPVRWGRVVRGVGVGAGLLLIFYSLLDETQRYSRMVLVLGSVWTLLAMLGVRGLLGLLGVEGFAVQRKARRDLLVGSREEVLRVSTLLNDVGGEPDFEGYVACDCSRPDDYVLGHVGQLAELVRIHKVGSVVFCAKDLPVQDIIGHMASLNVSGVNYKIVPADGDFAIGSATIDSYDDLYAVEVETIATPLNRRNKRLFDFLSALLLLLLSPLLFWFEQNKGQFFPHCLSVLVGRRTWVGYASEDGAAQPEHLPQLKPGVFSPASALGPRAEGVNAAVASKLNLRYARSYRVSADLRILLRNLFRI